MITAEERFMSKVDITDGCWLWFGSCYGNGYGMIYDGEKAISTHRFSFKTFGGDIPEGKWVLHSCDIKKCVNPEHLFLGNRSDNVNDAYRKGLIPSGENHHYCKISDMIVEEIKKLRKSNLTYRRIGQILCVSGEHVRRICIGTTRDNTPNSKRAKKCGMKQP